MCCKVLNSVLLNPGGSNYLKSNCIVEYAGYYQELVQYLKYTCPAHLYATSISPPSAQQIISSIKVILGEDGSNRGLAGTFPFSGFLLASFGLSRILYIYLACPLALKFLV